MSGSGSDFRAVRDAIWESSLPPSHRLVALRMVEHLPNVAPSVASLAEHTGLSKCTIMRCIADLQKWGCIRVSRQHGRRSEYVLANAWSGPTSLTTLPVAPCDHSHYETSLTTLPVAPCEDTSRTMRPPPVAPCDPKQIREADKEADKALASSAGAQPSLFEGNLNEERNGHQDAPNNRNDRGHAEGGSDARALAKRASNGPPGEAVTSAGQAVIVKPSRRRSGRSAGAGEHPIPVDWVPSEAHGRFAEQNDINLEREVFKFRGWAEGRLAASWDGRFTTWLGKAADYRDERAGSNTRVAARAPGKPSASFGAEDIA